MRRVRASRAERRAGTPAQASRVPHPQLPAGHEGPGMPPDMFIEALARRWVAFTHRRNPRDDLEPFEAEHDLVQRSPEEALAFIHAVRALDSSDWVIECLAAGPLEDLLATHGPAMIDRIVLEARRDPSFRHLLGGVWRNCIDEVVWEKLQAIVGARW